VSASNALLAGRAAFDADSWTEAFAQLSAADAQSLLEPEDLERLATAAFLVGNDAVSIDARSRAHEGFLQRGDVPRAATAVFWLVFTLANNPSTRAQVSGWIARAKRLVDDVKESGVERGWLMCGFAFQRVSEGDIAAAHEGFSNAGIIGEAFKNRDLIALARQGEGRTLLALNRTADGLALLDEVMVSVTRGEIAPMVSGMVYCSVISACHEIFDLRRAHEWTAALQHWCKLHPDLVPFRGLCLVYRSELMRLHGSWDDALDEARKACERLLVPPDSGLAHYHLAELHRLRGDFVRADEEYRASSQAGRRPYPGLALLRLAQGQAEAADAAIRLALREIHDRRPRVHLLRAAVEIMLAKKDVKAARVASDELEALAQQLDAPFVRAASAEMRAAVAIAEGDTAGSLPLLHTASATWQALDAPYDLAHTRVLTGMSYRQLGDLDGAQLEFEAAQEIFERLGAAPDVARVTAITTEVKPVRAQGLTGREVEVLRLIATGATNRTIASRLQISEKTVARHISNIFTKLDLPSRAAATAYAYEHRLV
jgi:DNA-binding CsgD family transcriptional regulator